MLLVLLLKHTTTGVMKTFWKSARVPEVVQSCLRAGKLTWEERNKLHIYQFDRNLMQCDSLQNINQGVFGSAHEGAPEWNLYARLVRLLALSAFSCYRNLIRSAPRSGKIDKVTSRYTFSSDRSESKSASEHNVTGQITQPSASFTQPIPTLRTYQPNVGKLHD